MRRPKEHHVKCAPRYFKPLQTGEKTAELRYNDRNYRVGDTLVVCEYSRNRYTGPACFFAITHVLRHFGALDTTQFGFEGWVMLSLRRWKSDEINAVLLAESRRMGKAIAKAAAKASPFLSLCKNQPTRPRRKPHHPKTR